MTDPYVCHINGDIETINKKPIHVVASIYHTYMDPSWFGDYHNPMTGIPFETRMKHGMIESLRDHDEVEPRTEGLRTWLDAFAWDADHGSAIRRWNADFLAGKKRGYTK